MTDEPRSWTRELPDHPYSTPNTREHRIEAASHATQWRWHAKLLALQAPRIPPLDRAGVLLEFWPGDARKRDADNLVSGVLKPVIDGLVDARVVPDDTPEHVTARMPVIHAGAGHDRRWRLTVTDLEGGR